MIQQIERQFVRTTRPLYGHLVHLFESAIARGDLPSGSRLPPERELAQRLRRGLAIARANRTAGGGGQLSALSHQLVLEQY